MEEVIIFVAESFKILIFAINDRWCWSYLKLNSKFIYAICFIAYCKWVIQNG
jgi:hypothetical protein